MEKVTDIQIIDLEAFVWKNQHYFENSVKEVDVIDELQCP